MAISSSPSENRRAIVPSNALRSCSPTRSTVKPSKAPRSFRRITSSGLPYGRSSSAPLTPGNELIRIISSAAAVFKIAGSLPFSCTSISRPGGPPRCRATAKRFKPGMSGTAARHSEMISDVRMSRSSDAVSWTRNRATLSPRLRPELPRVRKLDRISAPGSARDSSTENNACSRIRRFCRASCWVMPALNSTPAPIDSASGDGKNVKLTRPDWTKASAIIIAAIVKATVM